MRNLSIYLLALICFTSCYKDKGNYDYHVINHVAFGNFDSTKGYTVFLNDTLKVSPALTWSHDNNPSDDKYSYAWSFRFRVAANLPWTDTIVSTSKNLSTLIKFLPGNYPLQYRVTDKATGVTFQTRANVLVTSKIYEGYMVLNDVNGQSRLDMLSYTKATGQFTQYTDVLKEMGATFPDQGKPIQVISQTYVGTNITPQNYGIFLLTSNGTNRINQETFATDPKFNIRYLMVGSIPANFKADWLTGDAPTPNSIMFYMYANGNMYAYSTLAGYAFRNDPVNVYSAAGVPFKVSPYVVTDGTIGMLYNADKRCFVQSPSYNSSFLTDVAPGRNFPTGLDLVWMERAYNGAGKPVYAILKNPSTGKFYLLRFPLTATGVQSYFGEITATDFANATSYAVSPEMNYLFYSVGGKVYEYDFNAATPLTTLMIDKGNAVVSHLGFTHFFNWAAVANAATYKVWANQLAVGAYVPSGTPGANGTLAFYSIPDINRPLTKVSEYTGMGKIVSVAYRER